MEEDEPMNFANESRRAQTIQNLKMLLKARLSPTKKHSTSTHVQAGLVSYAKVVKNEPLIAEINFEHAEMKRTVTCCKIRRDYNGAVQRHLLINNHLI